jgi:hypothetical protein
MDVLLAVCGIIVLAIITLVIPLPWGLKSWLIALYRKVGRWLWALIAAGLLFLVQEFIEQRNAAKRADSQNPGPADAQRFEHQRNMYIAATAIVLAMILKVLMRAIGGFINAIQARKAKEQKAD